MELHLVGQGQGGGGEGQFRGGGPGDRQPGRGAGVRLGAERLVALLSGGVGVGVAALVRDVAVVHEADEPRLPLALGLDVGAQEVVTGVGGDVGEDGALQQRQLRGGVAGGEGTDLAGLDACLPRLEWRQVAICR